MNTGLNGGSAARLIYWRRTQRCWLFALFVWTAILSSPCLRGAVRFDVFLGFDGVLPEASWFPVVCEVVNDGPAFNAVIEIAPGSFADGQTRRMVVELPTGTLKRLVMPMFSSSRYSYEWSARLLDERGKVRAESSGLRPRRQQVWQIPLLGSISRTVPSLPEVKDVQGDIKPVVARLQPSVFPDHPLALEGLDSLYIASEEVLGNNLNVNQVNALLAWLFNGGHLVIGVEQITHVNSTPWLRRVIPMDFTDMKMVPIHTDLQRWLQGLQRYDGTTMEETLVGEQSGPNPFTKLAPDPKFEQQPMQVATGTVRDGRVVADSADGPLIVSAKRGRGQVTVLCFSPELEPSRSWVNRTYFWAKISDLPPEVMLESNAPLQYTGYSIDGVFGSMIESKQVRKLPVGWLLLLLLAYLAVIGPIDRYWLNKIGRQMLTWVTFPIYVALFSGLIYLIGYKLRAGETEYNELHLVDIVPLPTGGQADLRGRTYASIYSPVNARYPLKSDQEVATLRGEFLGNFRHGQDASRAEVVQIGNSFRADVPVPVWTSQLYVSDWLRKEPLPLTFTVAKTISGFDVLVDNQTETLLREARLVVEDEVLELGEIPPGRATTFRLPHSGQTLPAFVQNHGHMFVDAVNYRQQAFGGENRASITNLAMSAMAACFVSRLETERSYRNFITPPGLDLSPVARRGDAVLLAWAEGFSVVGPLNDFTARRTQRNTLFRLVQSVAGVPP